MRERWCKRERHIASAGSPCTADRLHDFIPCLTSRLAPFGVCWLMAAVFAPALVLHERDQTFTVCRWASTCHDSPSRKRAVHRVCGLSVAASRIAFIHARLQFFSTALFLDGPGLRQGDLSYRNQSFTALSMSAGRLYLLPAQKPAANKPTQNVSRMKSTMDQPSMAASTRSAVLAKASASATVLASTMSNLAPFRLSSSSRR